MNRPRRKLTDPRQPGAPLPPEWTLIGTPVESVLVAEARRAAVELIWALHRQRTAWAKFAQVKAELDERNITYVDNERPYSLASGDVKWWRAEVSSRANALTALLAAVQFFHPGRGEE